MSVVENSIIAYGQDILHGKCSHTLTRSSLFVYDAIIFQAGQLFIYIYSLCFVFVCTDEAYDL